MPRWADGCGVTVDHPNPSTTVALTGDVVKVAGDVDGDGYPDLFTSAYAETSNQ